MKPVRSNSLPNYIPFTGDGAKPGHLSWAPPVAAAATASTPSSPQQAGRPDVPCAEAVRNQPQQALRRQLLSLCPEPRTLPAIATSTLDRSAELQQMAAFRQENRARVQACLGQDLAALLGDVSPLDGARSLKEMKGLMQAIVFFGLEVELMKLDQHGKPDAMGKQAVEEIYETKFPEHEAIPRATIYAGLQQLQQSGRHLDGEYFSMNYTGKPPGASKTQAIAFAQGGTLHGNASKACYGYAEYWAVSDVCQGQGMLTVLMAFNSAISIAYGKKHGLEHQGLTWEMEHRGTGADTQSRLYTGPRSVMYAKKGAFAMMGQADKKSGTHRPYHVQPDVTQAGGSGNVPLHQLYRPHDPEEDLSSADRIKEIAVNVHEGEHRYFQRWADINQKNDLPGIDADRAQQAFDYRQQRLGDPGFTMCAVKPDLTPSEMDMARHEPLLAQAVATNLGIGDAARQPLYSNSRAREFIAQFGARLYAQEQRGERIAA